MTLELRIRVDERDVDLALTVPDGQTVAVLGENGSGKTTLVEAVAGLVVPDRGRIVLDGAVLFQADQRARTWIPAHRRGIGLLAQDPRLFPHLSVLDNVAFGPRSRGLGARSAREVALRTLGSVDAAGLARLGPAELSGGQAQRVALARALAVAPRLLLLDEPLAAVDVAAQDAIRETLREKLAATPALVVTHDVADAVRLAQRAIVIAGGRVVEDGPVQQVMTRPRTAFAARLAELNLVTGFVADGVLTTSAGLALPSGDAASGEALAAFPRGAVHLVEHPDGHPVETIRSHGPMVRVDVAGITADLFATAATSLMPGARVRVTVDPGALRVYRP